MSRAVRPVHGAGLEAVTVVRRGLEGIEVIKGPGWDDAVTRHERVLAHLDGAAQPGPGPELALRLVTDVAVLTVGDLRAATSTAASTYMVAGCRFVEWPRGAGWLDRRMVGGRAADLIEHRGGAVLRPADWSRAIALLRTVHNDVEAQLTWDRVVADAQAWWLDNLHPLLMAHAMRLQPLQPLARSAWERLTTGSDR